jgi:hypothetical protein
MGKFKQTLATYISIYRIIKFIKKSKKNSFIIGNEMSSIYFLIYSKFKHLPDIDSRLHNLNIYHLLLEQSDYNKFKISNFLNKNINFSKFFSILNTKILKLKEEYLWSYLRGYYINELDISNTNLNDDKKKFWFILYDYHLHYLLFIYRFMNTDLNNRGDIELLLNNHYDKYSINYITDELNYKMVFIHEPEKFNDSIKNVLKMFYLSTNSEAQLFNKDDKIMYNKYISYLNN